MKSEPDHVFWAKRWAYARSLCRQRRYPYPGVPDIAMLNYMTYLVEVYSFMFERRLKGANKNV